MIINYNKPAIRLYVRIFTGIRQQSVGVWSARSVDSARRQLRREQYGAGATDTDPEHAGD